MKIAVITDEFKTISAHFGRAQYYLVFTIEGGRITGQERRAKASHNQFAEQELHSHRPGEAHGTDPASQARHAAMLDPISDCQVLLARGMGMGAYNSLTARGIQTIMTDIPEIETAVKAYLDGQLTDHPERLH